LTRGVKRKLRADIVGAFAAVAVVCAVATGSASAGDGPVGHFKIDDAIRMVVKYYEGVGTIKITPTGAPDPIDHVAPATTTRVCATTEGAPTRT
jgi:hypothetical protein